MDTRTRTVGSMINQRSPSTSSQQGQGQSTQSNLVINTAVFITFYATFLSRSLTDRLPDLSNIRELDFSVIQDNCDLAWVATQDALEKLENAQQQGGQSHQEQLRKVV